jgi:exosortase family protein XrtM
MTQRDQSWDEFLNPEKTFLTKNPYVFLAFFAMGYAFLEWLYFLIPDPILQDVIHHYGIVQPCADILSQFAPQEGVRVVQGMLVSPGATLSIVRGCDGSGVIFLLVSAILAFPTGWRGKRYGMLGAVVMVYGLNQARLIGLYYIAAYHMEWFMLVHTYILPMLFILVGVIFFAYWSTRVTADDTGSQAA